MASYNRVVLLGNVTKDPEVRTSPASNTTVARTSIAVNRSYKDKSEAMYIDIVAFNKSAELMGEYVRKGTPLLVEGRLSMNKWEKDGVQRTKHEVIIDTFQMLGGRRSSENSDSSSEQAYSGHAEKNGDTIDEDDIPF